MLIITGTVVTLSISNLKTKNLTNMYADLKSLNDKIAVYYNSYGQLPVKEKFTGSYDFVIAANPNDDAELYYVIDASKLNNLILANNISWSGDDVYIINEKTHMIYYPKGVSLDGEMYYRLPGEYSKIEDTTLDKSDIAENADDFYGDYVINYTTPSGNPNVGWRIFYADESNIYLIADDYIHLDYAPESAKNTLYDNGNGYRLSFNNVLKDYNTGAANITDERITKWINYVKDYPSATGSGIKSVAFMLDEARWSAKYANPEYAEYAIGGPTLELWCASYKASHPDKYVECSYNGTGYQVKWSDSTSSPDYYIDGAEDDKDLYYIKSSTNKASYMWLASPSAVSSSHLMCVNYYGNVSRNYYSSSNTGFRPLVCLQSGIQLEKISDTELKIIEQ